MLLLLLLCVVHVQACAEYAPTIGSSQWEIEPSDFEVTWHKPVSTEDPNEDLRLHWVWPTVGTPEGIPLLYAETYHYLYSASTVVELPSHVTGLVNITVVCIDTHGGFVATMLWSYNSPTLGLVPTANPHTDPRLRWSYTPWNLTCGDTWGNLSYSVPALPGQHILSFIIQPDYSVESVLAIASVSIVACTEPASGPPA